MEKSNGLYEQFSEEILQVGVNPSTEELTEEQDEALREVYDRIVDAWEVEETLDDADFDRLIELLEDNGFTDFSH